MSELTGPLAGLVLLLILSAFFSGSETAMMAVSRYRLRYLERRGNHKAGLVRQMIDNPDRLLSAILLGNNFVNVAASALATLVAVQWLGEQRGALLATFLMTAVILVGSEIAPKTYAARHPERVALGLVQPIRLAVAVLGPLARVAAGAARALTFPLLRGADDRPRISLEEIKGMLDLGEEERVIAREKRRMLQSIFRLTETTIEDIMIPRTQVHAVAADASLEDVLRVIRESGVTRLPVYRDSLDDIVGILHSKDVVQYRDRPETLHITAIVRKPFYVPETATLETLLRLFQSQRQHLAIVIDEFGGVEGIVSLEDLLEEIVGDIEDEHDRERGPQLVELEPDVILVEGTCPLSLLNRRYGMGLEARESSTIAGYLMELSGGILQPGERLTHGGLTFNVRRASRNRIDLIRIEGVQKR